MWYSVVLEKLLIIANCPKIGMPPAELSVNCNMPTRRGELANNQGGRLMLLIKGQSGRAADAGESGPITRGAGPCAAPGCTDRDLSIYPHPARRLHQRTVGCGPFSSA